MRRLAWLTCLLVVVGCGPLTPPSNDGGAGGGGGAATGGGGGSSTGGGGGSSTGGGGGGSTGGGGGSLLPDGGLPPLTWASISVSATSTSFTPILGLGGVSGDVWALQENGNLFRSQNGPFTQLFTFQYGGKALYVGGSTVVVVQTRRFHTCTAGCTTLADYVPFELLDSGKGYNLFGEAVCGRGPNDISAVVTDTGNVAQLFHWDGAAWTRVDSNLGVRYPRACWYDAAGTLFVVGEGAVVRYEQGAATIEPLPTSTTVYYGGADVAGTQFVVGPSGFIARRQGTTWTPFSFSTNSPGALWAVGGLSANEVFALGYYNSTAGNGYAWNGASWRNAGDLLPGFRSQSQVRALLVTGPGELYVGGASDTAPTIARGRR